MSSNIDLVIFGARGDLAKRKLLPALYQLDKAGLLPDSKRVAAVARENIDTVEFIKHTSELFKGLYGEDNWDEKVWSRFSRRLHYIKVDFSQKKEFSGLKQWIVDKRTMIYYLATPPSLFGSICKHLDDAGCVTSTSRIVLEKPIGHDLQSSEQVNGAVGQYFNEGNIYRIDHYLGKETVQNLLALRFANRMINSQWDNSCIDHVQITAAETVGIEGRWSYYDKVGQLRDMVQNHLLQLLCMVAMEPPSSLKADEIRAEKVKLLRALRPICGDSVEEHAVRGQYSAGWISGSPVVGYMEEEGCESDSSNNETYVALKVHIDNWRWAGVPIYMRTGKKMPETVLEVLVEFKKPPRELFGRGNPNAVRFRLGAKDGVDISLLAKKPGTKLATEEIDLTVEFVNEFGDRQGPYERLLRAAILGDHFRFTRIDAVLHSWKILEDILKSPTRVHPYFEGTWGPDEAQEMIPGGWNPVGTQVED